MEELQRKLEKSERINEKFEPELDKWKLRNAFLKLMTCLWAARARKWAEPELKKYHEQQQAIAKAEQKAKDPKNLNIKKVLHGEELINPPQIPMFDKKPILHVSDIRENDKCIRKLTQFVQGSTNTNLNALKRKLEARIETLNNQNADLQRDVIYYQKDKNIFISQNEALDQKCTDLGLKILMLENKLRYSQEDTRKAMADIKAYKF